jgi:hypothetical protein
MMKVVYELDIDERVYKAIQDAHIAGKKIDCIMLDEFEFKQLVRKMIPDDSDKRLRHLSYKHGFFRMNSTDIRVQGRIYD